MLFGAPKARKTISLIPVQASHGCTEMWLESSEASCPTSVIPDCQGWCAAFVWALFWGETLLYCTCLLMLVLSAAPASRDSCQHPLIKSDILSLCYLSHQRAPRSNSFPAWPYSCPHLTFSLPQGYQHRHECCRVSSSFVCRWQQIHVLVNYLQVLMITCRRYGVGVGVALMNLVLKLEKSSWWEEGQGSLLLGCVGQTVLVGQQLK